MYPLFFVSSSLCLFLRICCGAVPAQSTVLHLSTGSWGTLRLFSCLQHFGVLVACCASQWEEKCCRGCGDANPAPYCKLEWYIQYLFIYVKGQQRRYPHTHLTGLESHKKDINAKLVYSFKTCAQKGAQSARKWWVTKSSSKCFSPIISACLSIHGEGSFLSCSFSFSPLNVFLVWVFPYRNEGRGCRLLHRS